MLSEPPEKAFPACGLSVKEYTSVLMNVQRFYIKRTAIESNILAAQRFCIKKTRNLPLYFPGVFI